MDADKSDVYEWGLQMFQPKWDGSPETLDIVAKAASETYPGADEIVSVAQDLNGCGKTAMAESFLDKAIAAVQAWVAREPNNGNAHWELGTLLRQNKDMLGATREYRIAAGLLPKNADVACRYGECFQEREMMVRSIAPLMAAEALDPARLLVHYDIGYALKATGKYPEAETQFKDELLLEPDSLNTHYGLGELYENIAEAELQEGDLTDARANWRKVAGLDTGQVGTDARKFLAKYP